MTAGQSHHAGSRRHRRVRHRRGARWAAGLSAAALLCAVLAGSVSAQNVAGASAAAAAHRCAAVHVRHRAATHVRTNLRCARARRMLRRWLRRHRLPHNQFGWYCSGRRRVVCGGGNGGAAPYIRFSYRR